LTLFRSEVESLGLPLQDAYATALQYIRIIWTAGDPIQGVLAAHLYFNLYVAMLDLWRDVNNRPITTKSDTSTSLYPELLLTVAPSIYLPPDKRLTPNIAAVVLYKMLEKCLMESPTFWTATLITRDASLATVAIFHSKQRLGAIPVTSSNTISSGSAGASDISDKPGNASNVVPNSHMTVHVGFQGYLPEPNPRTRWLAYLLAWSFSLLFVKTSTDDVVTFADGVILSIWFKPRADLRVAVESRGVTAPSGASKLTCELYLPSIVALVRAYVVL